LKMPFPVRIVVSGEEDLLALPLFVMVPNGSVVLYGQPLEGMVIVRIDETVRWKARDLLYRIGAPIC
jgi:GTP-dependent dephospho-CoA kinase